MSEAHLLRNGRLPAVRRRLLPAGGMVVGIVVLMIIVPSRYISAAEIDVVELTVQDVQAAFASHRYTAGELAEASLVRIGATQGDDAGPPAQLPGSFNVSCVQWYQSFSTEKGYGLRPFRLACSRGESKRPVSFAAHHERPVANHLGMTGWPRRTGDRVCYEHDKRVHGELLDSPCVSEQEIHRGRLTRGPHSSCGKHLPTWNEG